MSHFPQKLQHRNHRHDNARQARPDRDPPDSLFLEGIKASAKGCELSLHPVVSVLAADDDFQGEEAAVEGREALADVFPAQFAMVLRCWWRVAHKRAKYLTVFSLCVEVLEWAAQKVDPFWPGGMDYEKINVLIFCVLLPVVLVFSIGMNIYFLVR